MMVVVGVVLKVCSRCEGLVEPNHAPASWSAVSPLPLSHNPALSQISRTDTIATAVLVAQNEYASLLLLV